MLPELKTSVDPSPEVAGDGTGAGGALLPAPPAPALGNDGGLLPTAAGLVGIAGGVAFGVVLVSGVVLGGGGLCVLVGCGGVDVGVAGGVDGICEVDDDRGCGGACDEVCGCDVLEGGGTVVWLEGVL